MVIVGRVRFHWGVDTDNDRVTFSVEEEPLHVLWYRYWSNGKIPPLSEKVKYYRLAGYDESYIKRIVKAHKEARKNSEKNQKALDDAFAKFKIKPTKKKVLKPVKKNL